MRKFAVMIYSTTRKQSKFFRFGPLTASISSIVLCILFCSNRLGATTHTDTLRCGSTSTFTLDSTLAGITLDDTIRIIGISDTDTSVSIKLTNDSGAYSLTDRNLFSVRRDSVHLLFLHFAPRVLRGFIGSLELSFGTCNYTVQLVGSGIGPTTNNSVFSLSNAVHVVIAFQFQNTDSESLRLSFRNDLGDTIHVRSVSFVSPDTTIFRVNSLSGDSTIPPKAFFDIQVTSYLYTPGSLVNNLLMEISKPDHTIIEDVISVQSLRLADNAVSPSAITQTHIWLYPNPAHGSTTIHSEGLTHVHAIISDVLGRRIREESFARDWLWDARTSSGGIAPAGIYFITVTGIDENGKSVSTIEPVILE